MDLSKSNVRTGVHGSSSLRCTGYQVVHKINIGPYMCEATPTRIFNQNLGICAQH